jgi:P-aminobenzoate N-oxygenase AurF
VTVDIPSAVPTESTGPGTISAGLDEANAKMAALCRASTRRGFDPFIDIDWDTRENDLDEADPRWQLQADIAPLAMTDWYAQQPLQRRIDMGRWMTANILKVTLQFEMMLIRGVTHHAGTLPNGSAVFRYLLHELTDECHHIQMFQEFINRTGADVPGMRRGSRFFGPILGFIGGYANIFLFIGVLCGEQPLHFQQTLQHRGASAVPPLLNTITSIHLLEEARHISFADTYLAQRIATRGWIRRLLYSLAFPILLRWLVGEMITPPRAFARQFGIPRRVFKAAYWRSARSRQMLAESTADVRRVAEDLGLRTAWSRWLWRVLGIEGRLPRFRGEPDRSQPVVATARTRTVTWARIAAAAIMAGIAVAATPVGPRIITVATIGAAAWTCYHTARASIGGIVSNQRLEWPRLAVWVVVCGAMIPAGGLIGLALVVFMILALAEFMPTI